MPCGQPQTCEMPLALSYPAELAGMQERAAGMEDKGPLVSTLSQPRVYLRTPEK